MATRLRGRRDKTSEPATPPSVDEELAAVAAEARAEHQAEASFKPAPAGWAARLAVYGVVALIVLLFPLTQAPSDVLVYNRAVAFAIIGLSLNVLVGYTGQISLGHQAFVGIGAFTAAYVVTVQKQNFALAMLAAMVVGGLQAAILGSVSLRIRGLYFALVTLSYGLVAETSIFQIQSLTGGGAGQPAPKPSGFTTDHRYYFLCLAFLAAVLWVDWRMMRSKGGRALLALRENPRVASTFGVNVKAFTMFAFIVAGVFAAVGGALYGFNDTFVQANVFDFRLALLFVLMTVVGGLRSRTGVVIGSAFFALLDYLIEKIHLDGLLKAIPWAPDLTAEKAPFVIGPLLLLLTLTMYPGGIGQQIRPIQRWLSGHKFNIHDRGDKEVQISDVRA